ncbi:MAG: AbrB/MazE/SpoVT family DNA-binding domain-containing protein [Ruminococcus sp.]|nr:AbrB/MazE/SpoVT family DNA-binding domain-containing protein [Ruminococcus sp.]
MKLVNNKEIDKAGRLVISKDIRNHLNIHENDILLIEADDHQIIIKKAQNSCIFCNSNDNLTEFKGKFICQKCKSEINL